jgi:hypothetical protein
LVVSPDGERGSLTIGQDARLLVGLFDAGESCDFALEPGRSAWLHVARGEASVNGTRLGPGDGAAIRDEPTLHLRGVADAELVLWDLASDRGPAR